MTAGRRRCWPEKVARGWVLVLAMLVAGTAAPPGPAPAAEPATSADPAFPSVEMPATTRGYRGDRSHWTEQVPRIQDVRVVSSVDGAEQPSWWLPPAGPGPQPLLVVLHSWSYGYEQHLGVPYARWADQAGWALLHPHFRGRFDNPQATGSDLAVADVIDAIDFARAHAEIDEDHVYAIGFSGGGLMALLMAGRHPDRFAGVVSWVGMYDLTDWHAYNRGDGNPRYADDIEASCGGDPTSHPDAHESCRHRSPRSHIDGAGRAGVPVYTGGGLDDRVVTPDHPLMAFNDLAERDDRLDADTMAAAAENRLPPGVHGSVDGAHFFGPGDPVVAFARTSGPVTGVVFEGGHEMVYRPSLRWIWHLRHHGAPRP